jgi:hypothetical protein
VAFKDEAGRLLVSEEVQKTWDAAHNTLPGIKTELETEFRALLGVR